MSTWDRCITRGVPGSMLPTGYNNYRILQTGDTVVVMHEMIHDARIISVTDRSHVDGSILQWMGDARARWEGDTLVPGYDMYEYACHEGNRDVEIHLGGGRADKRSAGGIELVRALCPPSKLSKPNSSRASGTHRLYRTRTRLGYASA